MSGYTISVPPNVTRLQVFIGDSTYGTDPSDGDISPAPPAKESAPPR
jgi:hypothetical protein